MKSLNFIEGVKLLPEKNDDAPWCEYLSIAGRTVLTYPGIIIYLWPFDSTKIWLFIHSGSESIVYLRFVLQWSVGNWLNNSHVYN